MITSRRFAGLLLVAGVLIGTFSDRVDRRPPARSGDYWVLAGDFHVHGFPDGLPPWTLRAEAARAGLDVFAQTDHNRTFTARLARWLSDSSDGPLVLVGQEVTNPDFHLIAVGLERTVNAFQPAKDVIDDIHAQGGVAIAAHPGPRATGFDRDAIARLDGSELAHSAIHVSDQARIEFANFFQRVRAVNPDVAPIGSSDFHASPSLARCRTLLFVRERTRDGVLEAIRNGRTVAMDGDGRMYGEPELVRLTEASPPGGRVDPHPVRRRISVTLAWIGLLGLVIFKEGTQ
jgi:hypothetical protein